MFEERRLSRLIATQDLPDGGSRGVRLMQPALLHKTINDQYPTIQRTIHELGDTPLKQGWEQAMKNAEDTMFNNGIRFSSPQRGIGIEIINTADNMVLNIAAEGSVKKLVTAKYDPQAGQIKIVGMEAEPFEPRIEIHQEGQPAPHWRNNLGIFINFLKVLSRGALKASGEINNDQYQEFLDDHFPDKDNQLIHEVNRVAQHFADVIWAVAYVGDKTEEEVIEKGGDDTRDLLNAYGLKDVFAKALLQELEDGVRISDIEPDEFLSTQIAGQIESLALSEETFSSQLLEATGFTATDFQYKEVNAEGAIREIIKEDRASFGDEIRILGETFSIYRQDKNFAIACLARTRRSWEADIPQTLPVEELRPYLNDPDTDCRGAQRLIKVGFHYL